MIAVKLRAHNLLCLASYQGLGYNQNFVENMNHVHDKLFDESKSINFILQDYPDKICKSCPNLNLDKGCTLRERSGDKSQEVLVSIQDKKVIKRLDLKAGKIYSNKQLLNNLRKNIEEEDRKKLCGDCLWQKICVKNYPFFLKSGKSVRKDKLSYFE